MNLNSDMLLPAHSTSHVKSLESLDRELLSSTASFARPISTPSENGELESSAVVPRSLLQMLQKPSTPPSAPEIAEIVGPSGCDGLGATNLTSCSALLAPSSSDHRATLMSSLIMPSSAPGIIPTNAAATAASTPPPPQQVQSQAQSPSQSNTGRFKSFHEDKWSQRLSELRQFRLQHGHSLVPHAYPQNKKLACWVKRQRRQYKLMNEGRTSTMSPERITLLEDLDFVWDSHTAVWNEKLEELRTYKSVYGNCLVPSTFAKNPQLAVWVKCQRRQYKLFWAGKASSMTTERIERLEREGFCWGVRPIRTTATAMATAAVAAPAAAGSLSQEEATLAPVPLLPLPCGSKEGQQQQQEECHDDDLKWLYETINML